MISAATVAVTATATAAVQRCAAAAFWPGYADSVATAGQSDFGASFS
jgi:hypothetical protein